MLVYQVYLPAAVSGIYPEAAVLQIYKPTVSTPDVVFLEKHR